MKSILVPMGNTGHSAAALQAAITIAEKVDAVIRGVYVKDLRKARERFKETLPYPTISPDLNQSILEKTLESVVTEMDREEDLVSQTFRDTIKGHDVKNKFIVQTGELSEIVLQLEKSCDLIVMGKSREAENPKTPVLSSYAKKIIQKSFQSALVITEGHFPGNRILLAYGGSKTAGKALKETARFAKLFNAEVFALCVNEELGDTSPYLEIVENYLEPYGINVEKIWKKSSVVDAIVHVVEEKDIDLLIMGAYGHESWKEFIFGSNTEKVIKRLDIPMLLCS